MPFALNNLFLMLGVALTPQERFRAMGRFNGGQPHFFADHGYELAGWLTIALLVLILGILYNKRTKKKNLTERNFQENAMHFRLNSEEQDIVAAVAALAGVKQKNSVFTLRRAFDVGLSRLTHEVFAVGQTPAERKKFHEAILSIKTKLGFIGSQSKNGVASRSGRERTTRQIPVGTKVSLSFSSDESAERFSAEITQNGNFEFSLCPETPITCQLGDIWTIQYNDGATTWEFEAVTTTFSQENISFGHSEHIRYVNRRRFTRVKTNKPARIALFPVFDQMTASRQMELSFVPAVITEIAGPCLQVKTGLSVRIRQRVLLVFNLEGGRLVQDVGQVRDIRRSEAGDAIIIELIGLHAKAIGELVRVANQIARDEASETEAAAQAKMEVGS